MSIQSGPEQLMLDLINQERRDAGFGTLTFSDTLNESSEDHSSWMLDQGVFSHTGVSGSSSYDRIVNAGYDFDGNWRTGENIAFQSERGAAGIEDDVADLHEALMDSPGHRANILNPSFTQIGIGIETGVFSPDTGGSFEAVMVTQNFAYSMAYNPAPSAVVTTPVQEPAEDPVVTDNLDLMPEEPVADMPGSSDNGTTTQSDQSDAPIAADDFDFEPVKPDIVDPETPALLMQTINSVNAACDAVLAGTDFSELVQQSIDADIYANLCPSNLDGILAQIRDALSDYYGSGGCGAEMG